MLGWCLGALQKLPGAGLDLEWATLNWKDHNYKVFMVSASAGKDFGRDTMRFLGRICTQKGMLLAVPLTAVIGYRPLPGCSHEQTLDLLMPVPAFHESFVAPGMYAALRRDHIIKLQLLRRAQDGS